MALPLKRKNFRISSAATGALVIGAGLILIKTFPHIKASISTCVFGTKKGDDEEDDNRPVEVRDSLESQMTSSVHSGMGESAIEISEWSDEDLKSYLLEVRLYSYSFTIHTNDFRKKSIFHLMLQMIILYPLSRAFRSILDFNIIFIMFLRSRVIEIFNKFS